MHFAGRQEFWEIGHHCHGADMFKSINVEDAKKLIRQRSTVILDVRDFKSYADVRIPGSIHVTISTIRATLQQIRKQTPLLLCCYRGYASLDFAEFFSELGFVEVYWLEGGFHAWYVAHGEVEGSATASGLVYSNPAIDWLMDSGGDSENVNAPLSDGTLPLLRACREGLHQVVAGLLEAGADPYLQDKNGNDALWVAVKNDRLDCLTPLLESGQDINRQNSKGETALMYASEIGNVRLVRLLINAGADVLVQNSAGLGAIDLAASSEIVLILSRVNLTAA